MSKKDNEQLIQLHNAFYTADEEKFASGIIADYGVQLLREKCKTKGIKWRVKAANRLIGEAEAGKYNEDDMRVIEMTLAILLETGEIGNERIRTKSDNEFVMRG